MYYRCKTCTRMIFFKRENIPLNLVFTCEFNKKSLVRIIGCAFMYKVKILKAQNRYYLQINCNFQTFCNYWYFLVFNSYLIFFFAWRASINALQSSCNLKNSMMSWYCFCKKNVKAIEVSNLSMMILHFFQ